jgi:hypothetical protein
MGAFGLVWYVRDENMKESNRALTALAARRRINSPAKP